MLGAIRQSESGRGVMAALALLVLAIQLVAPSGFMPLRTERGVVVTLCTGQGAINVMVERDRAPAKAGHSRDDGAPVPQQHCAFSASVQPLVPPLVLADIALPAWRLAFGPIAFALRTGLIARLAAPPPPSSGPPALF